jgi:methyl-accepting chemotaxis protein
VSIANQTTAKIAQDVQASSEELKKVSSGIENVNRGIGEAADGAKDINARSRVMSGRAEDLGRVVARFKV